MPDTRPAPRRLAAVWFADIVGYSRLASRDEDRALRQVRLLQHAAREAIEAGGGRLIKFSGDGVLAEFTGTDAAVRSALALTDAFAEATKTTGVGGALRVGVHVGDIVAAEDGDVYGTGVNTAARL